MMRRVQGWMQGARMTSRWGLAAFVAAAVVVGRSPATSGA